MAFKKNLTNKIMTDTIKQKLLELEQSENIKICYACESGSRAWGFPSPNSALKDLLKSARRIVKRTVKRNAGMLVEG